MNCPCRVPNERRSRDTNAPTGRCVQCGWSIDPAWTSAKTTQEFYDDLAEGCFPRDTNTGLLAVPDDFQVFRIEAEAREMAGRLHFGHRHLSRDNLVDARQEASDGANYFHFRYLQAVRDGSASMDMRAAVLRGARHFYLAHKMARDPELRYG